MKDKPKIPIVFPSVDEMKCDECNTVTGHKINEHQWTCVICQTPSFTSSLWQKIKLYLKNLNKSK